MQSVVRKGKVNGSVTVPSSKSIMQRFMIAALLSTDETELQAVSHCSDTISCLNAIRSFNAVVSEGQNEILNIKGVGNHISPSEYEINCGESGFALRALSAVAALSDLEIQLSGSGSLMKRPVGFMTDVFTQLEVKCITRDGLLPLTLHGPVHFKDIFTDGSFSSQFLSGLLMIFPFADEDHVIEVQNLKSKFYIDLTMDVMRNFGIEISHENYRKFIIPGRQLYKGCTTEIEADWSAASCMLVAGATTGEVTVENLSPDSKQPDRMILQVLEETGAEILKEENKITVKKPSQKNLLPFSFDATDCPDLFPALTVLASQCSGISEITGVERLIHKESNRAVALQEEFSKFRNGIITIEGNVMRVDGGKLKGGKVHSHHDHRIAMALAVAGLNAEGETAITESEAVSKSYPDFFDDLSRLINHE